VHDTERGPEQDQVLRPRCGEQDRDQAVAGGAREGGPAVSEAIDQARAANAHGQRRERVRHEESAHGADPVRQRVRRHEGRHGGGGQAADREHTDHERAAAHRARPALGGGVRGRDGRARRGSSRERRAVGRS